MNSHQRKPTSTPHTAVDPIAALATSDIDRLLTGEGRDSAADSAEPMDGIWLGAGLGVVLWAILVGAVIGASVV